MDLETLLFGKEGAGFLPEVFLRSAVMFVVLCVGIRLMGKRGVGQLSVFELVVIIGLGSAAGDPMFYEDVGLLPGVAVFVTVIVLYRIAVKLVAVSEPIDRALEGSPMTVVRDGVFETRSFRKETLAQDEFFSEMRMKGVTHLGQVEEAILETTGVLSLIFFEDERVAPGLPILPRHFGEQVTRVEAPGLYACAFCGRTAELGPGEHRCGHCERRRWVRARSERRVR